MKSSEHKGVCISPPICTNKLIFGKGAFFILFCLNNYAVQSHNFTINFNGVTIDIIDTFFFLLSLTARHKCPVVSYQAKGFRYCMQELKKVLV